jgi:hypothetical protein
MELGAIVGGILEIGLAPVLLVLFVYHFINQGKRRDERELADWKNAIARENMIIADSARREELLRAEYKEREDAIRAEYKEREQILRLEALERERILNGGRP